MCFKKIEEKWCIYIAKTQNGTRIAIDCYFDNKPVEDFLEKDFPDDNIASFRALEISKELNIPLFNFKKDIVENK